MAEPFNAAAQAQARTRARAQFKPFVWNPLDGLMGDPLQRALFLNHARDVVDGAHTLLQLLAWDEDEHEGWTPDCDGPLPLFDGTHRASLHRLVVASLGKLHADIEAQREAMSEPMSGAAGAAST
jgi:hypothetical protein